NTPCHQRPQEELSDNFKVADSWEWPAYVQQCLNQLSESAGFTSAGCSSLTCSD
ncbi:hypothetical protein J6590_107192, partial [Homalodisca vitripennis]